MDCIARLWCGRWLSFTVFLLLPMSLQVSSTPVPVSMTVGDPVTLPCEIPASTAAGIAVNNLHIQWKNSRGSVLESVSGRLHIGHEFQGRVELSGNISQGNFSLTINNTWISDELLYECFYGVNTPKMKFVTDVFLIIKVRNETHGVQWGQDLSLVLYTGEPVEVLFNGTVLYSGSKGASVGKVTAPDEKEPGPRDEPRVSVRGETLIVSRVTSADQGQYTVRDNGTKRIISTISVSVSEEDPSPSALFPAAVTAVCVSLVAVTVLIMCLKEKTLLKKLCLRCYPGYEKTATHDMEANSLDSVKKHSRSCGQQPAPGPPTQPASSSSV